MNTNMTIPQCRERLNEIAENLPRWTFAKAQEEIRKVIEQMHRRPAVRRARPQSVSMTPEVRKSIHRVAERHPHWSYKAIGEYCGVSVGRVSETLAGFRQSAPSLPATTPLPPTQFYAHAPAL